jgi:hypothetical protein
MEEMMIRFLEGKCTAEEINVLKQDPVVWGELTQIQRLDVVFAQNVFEKPGPLLNDRILQNLNIQAKEKSWDFRDFILPILFGLGSIIYFLFAKQNLQTPEHLIWFEIPQGSQAIAILGSALSLLLLVLLDQFLQKKAGRTLGLFAMVS